MRSRERISFSNKKRIEIRRKWTIEPHVVGGCRYRCQIHEPSKDEADQLSEYKTGILYPWMLR